MPGQIPGTRWSAAESGGSPIDLPALVRRAQQGDEQALEGIICLYHQSLWRTAYRLVGEAGLAEDVLQEAYLKAFRGLPRFHPESAEAVYIWLARIVYRQAVDELRRASRRRRLRDRLSRERAWPVETVGRADGLGSAVAGLPLDLRAAVVVVYVLGFDYRSAGRVLGIPPGTVSSRIHRAKAELRRDFHLDEEAGS